MFFYVFSIPFWTIFIYDERFSKNSKSHSRISYAPIISSDKLISINLYTNSSSTYYYFGVSSWWLSSFSSSMSSNSIAATLLVLLWLRWSFFNGFFSKLLKKLCFWYGLNILTKLGLLRIVLGSLSIYKLDSIKQMTERNSSVNCTERRYLSNIFYGNNSLIFLTHK